MVRLLTEMFRTLQESRYGPCIIFELFIIDYENQRPYGVISSTAGGTRDTCLE